MTKFLLRVELEFEEEDIVAAHDYSATTVEKLQSEITNMKVTQMMVVPENEVKK